MTKYGATIKMPGWSYTEMIGAEFTNASSDAWQDYDIYTNMSVPKGAIAEIWCQNTTSAPMIAGVRTDGSLLERKIAMLLGNRTCMRMFVKVDSTTGLIETYSDNISYVSFQVVGYFTGVDFVENWAAVGATGDNAWEPVDISSMAPINRVVAVSMFNNEAAANNIGVRRAGSGLTRYIKMCSSNSTSNYNPITYLVKNSSSGTIEIFEEDASEVDGYVQGYFGANLDYVEKTQVLTLGVNDWNAVDCTSYLDVDGRLCDILSGNENATNARVTGMRGGDSTNLRYIDLRDTLTASAYVIVGANCRSNASGVVSIYSEEYATNITYMMGYYL